MASSMGMEEKPGEISLVRAAGLVLVLDTPKGRGVFAGRDIAAGTVLEVSPVLVLSLQENEEHIRKTDLYNYTYNWPLPSSDSSPKAQNTQAVVLGLGSLFNHSARRQNVGWKRDLEKTVVIYTALQDVKQGEELCIAYGDRLTFVDADAKTVDSDDEDEDAILRRIDLI